MRKAMTQTTGAPNLRVTMAIAAFAVVLLALTLVAVVQTAPTTTDRGDANPAMSAEASGESRSVSYDYYLDQHTELVHRLNNGGLR
jgi:hypothetical protein